MLARAPAFRPTLKVIICACWLSAVGALGFSLPSFWANPARDAEKMEEQDAKEPLFADVGDYSRRISTSVPLAQEYFDQGLAFLYAYNQPAAAHSFAAVAAEDPRCAMGFWGLAMAEGPLFNKMNLAVPEATLAQIAVTKARELALAEGTPVERKLIEALSQRFSEDPKAKREPLDAAYANAMRQLYREFADDPDVGALTAEAILDLSPWDQWTLDGKAGSGTEEVIRILTATLTKAPRHPFASHLLIHTLEASPHPEQAATAAEFLRTWAPGLEHLVHMPSHIDCRLGRWQQAVISNEKAIAAEKAYQALAQRDEPYRLWPAHNYHVLAFAAMMQGCERKARAAIDEMLSAMPESFIREHAMEADGFFATQYEIDLRFGRWRELLARIPPRRCLVTTTALWHYGRGIAFSAQQQLPAAATERTLFRELTSDISRDCTVGGTPVRELLELADNMLEGEILYREGKVTTALARLREAVNIEDHLRYAEPPLWFVPVRHALGATLMDAHLYAEAEAVYREDLRRYPENGWSLYGLARSLKVQGKEAKAAVIMLRFKQAWKFADFKISSSCCCLRGKDSALDN
jgi:tetratricopeptide (TPR) repeat protein